MLLKLRKYRFICSLTIVFFSCAAPKQITVNQPVLAPVVQKVEEDLSKTTIFLEELLNQYPDYFGNILKNRNNWNVQIIYTQIDRGANGIPALKNFYFNVNPDRYFYPASTIKLPLSMLSLQKLNELNITGLDKNTTMITGAADESQTAVYNDPTVKNGKPSIDNYIKKMLIGSDNDAGNRMYEFLGQEYINTQLQKKGCTDVQILHRLGIWLTPEENRVTNPIQFLMYDNSIIWQKPLQTNSVQYKPRKDTLGKGYWSNGKFIDKPLNFSTKNKINLEDLHGLLSQLVFPAKTASSQRMLLSDADRMFLLKNLSMYPSESSAPPYKDDTIHFWPTVNKFIFYGAEKAPLTENIRIFNKAGEAYGQLTDVAYIVDFEKKIEFFVSATIYCNQDEILNDDQYDYKNIGLPFMKNLGRVLYTYEQSRQRNITPDLSSVQFNYAR